MSHHQIFYCKATRPHLTAKSSSTHTHGPINSEPRCDDLAKRQCLMARILSSQLPMNFFTKRLTWWLGMIIQNRHNCMILHAYDERQLPNRGIPVVQVSSVIPKILVVSLVGTSGLQTASQVWSLDVEAVGSLMFISYTSWMACRTCHQFDLKLGNPSCSLRKPMFGRCLCGLILHWYLATAIRRSGMTHGVKRPLGERWCLMCKRSPKKAWLQNHDCRWILKILQKTTVVHCFS